MIRIIKILQRGLLTTVACLLAASAAQSFAIEGLKIAVRCPDVILSWPSATNETYIVQYRPDLGTNSTWVTLTNSLPAATDTNVTFFVHSNMVTCPSGGGGGSPPSFNGAMSLVSGGIDAPVSVDASPLPVWVIQRRPPHPWELENRPPFPWEAGASLPAPLQRSSAPGVSAFSQGADNPQPLDDSGGGGSGGDPGFYRVVRNGPSLFGATNSMVLSGSVTFPIEFGGTNRTPLEGFMLYVDGEPASMSDIGTNALGQWVLTWHTSSVTNGTHTLNVSANPFVEDYSIDQPIDGVVRTVSIDNGIMFPYANLGFFGDYLWVYFQTKDASVDYHVDVYIQTNVYIGSFVGSITNGVESFLWDPVASGFTNDEFRCEFYVQRSTAGPLDNGGNYSNTNRWYVREQAYIGARQMVVAFAAPTASATVTARAEAMVRTGVLEILDGSYGFNPPNNPYASAVELTAVSKPSILGFIGDTTYRYCYIFAHGSPSSFSPWNNATARITEREIMSATGNILNTAKPVANHPCRLVWIDGCESAKGSLCEVFGIPSGQYDNNFFNLAGRRSRAFLGAYEKYDYNYNTMDTRRAEMLALFWNDWLRGQTIWQCCTNAAAYPLDPLKLWKIHGATNFTINTP